MPNIITYKEFQIDVNVTSICMVLTCFQKHSEELSKQKSEYWHSNDKNSTAERENGMKWKTGKQPKSSLVCNRLFILSFYGLLSCCGIVEISQIYWNINFAPECKILFPGKPTLPLQRDLTTEQLFHTASLTLTNLKKLNYRFDSRIAFSHGLIYISKPEKVKLLIIYLNYRFDN